MQTVFLLNHLFMQTISYIFSSIQHGTHFESVFEREKVTSLRQFVRNKARGGESTKVKPLRIVDHI